MCDLRCHYLVFINLMLCVYWQAYYSWYLINYSCKHSFKMKDKYKQRKWLITHGVWGDARVTKGNIVKIKLLAFLRSGAKGKRVVCTLFKIPFWKRGKKEKGKKEKKNETQKYLLNKGGRSINLPGFFARIPLFSSET